MKLFIIIGLAAVVCDAARWQDRRFPDDFLFGAATAAYQIEGGWNSDDKGESIWDRLTHTNPGFIADRSNGDIAADTFSNYRTDVQMMRELGLDAYRFSIAWSRILPNGISNKVSKAGLTFYNNYINEMVKYNITPMATLYHWDLPQKLQDLGGFMNPNFHEWFEDYARIAFENFGDRVKHWITFNEPREICYEGYGSDTKAPVINATDVGTYYCAKNLVIAHAKAYHAYVNDFKPRQGGVCGITISVNWFGPLTESEDDWLAADVKGQAEWGLYAEPIFSENGGFPAELCEIVARKSAEQGYRRSRMPQFTEEERNLVRGSSDFFGINHYSGSLVSATQYKQPHPVPSLSDDAGVGIYIPPEWPKSASSWLRLSPNSLYYVLTHLDKKYNKPIIYVTENGWSESPKDGYYIDNGRVKYFRAKLNDALDALEAGVNLRGYMAWSLMDNFEWNRGYLERFGLYEVNFKSDNRERRPRKSAFVYKQIIKTRVVDPNYEPDTRTMWIDDGHNNPPTHYNNQYFSGPFSVYFP
ncbi:myrosinase 1-like [Maniola hyperantus]|uniref:myrosinase 1-like n=1 Tax=Aphantopus hyperantus TaxID=2795564 RepID=UPI0015693A5C|nr:myrosinase 1-like [Maniola hyperantus]